LPVNFLPLLARTRSSCWKKAVNTGHEHRWA
jgi:hypothetical protein